MRTLPVVHASRRGRWAVVDVGGIRFAWPSITLMEMRRRELRCPVIVFSTKEHADARSRLRWRSAQWRPALRWALPVDDAISELVPILAHRTTAALLTLAILFGACQPANPVPHHVFAPPPVVEPQAAVDTTGVLDDDADPQPDRNFSDATPKISIDQAIADLGTVAELDPPRQGSPATSRDWLDAGEDGVDFDKSSLCFAADGQAKPVAIADLCSNVEAKMTGMDRAASYPLEMNPDTWEKRFASVNLRRLIFPYVASEFIAIKGDPEHIRRCCGGDAVCAELFDKTELYLIPDMPNGHPDAWYQLDKAHPYIGLGELKALRCKNKACIRYLLAHELGHACQYSRHHFRGAMYYCNSLVAVTQRDFIADFGAPVAERIGRALQAAITAREALHLQEEVCAGRWFNEAYADAIFMDLWRSPSGYNQGCWNNLLDLDDPAHGPFVALEAVLDSPRIRESICGAVPTQLARSEQATSSPHDDGVAPQSPHP